MAAPISTGQTLPSLTLLTTSGERLRLTAYRGKANLALYLMPAGDSDAVRECLEAVEAHLPAYRERHAQPVAILAGPLTRAQELQTLLHLSYPLLADPDGHATRSLASMVKSEPAEPVVVLTDRYTELRTIDTGWDALRAGKQADILEWLTYIDYLCSC